MQYEFICVSKEDAVGIITLNRPNIPNAINLQSVDELVAEMERLDQDPKVRVILLTGNEKAFAAGADINEMAEASAIEIMKRDQFAAPEANVNQALHRNN